jgi:hypothetical protein
MFDVRQLMGEEVEMRIFTGDPQSLRKIARGVVGISNVGTTLSAISIGSRLASGYFDDLKIWGEVAHLEVELATYQTTVPDLENLEPLSF